jgi:hypothetical protein
VAAGSASCILLSDVQRISTLHLLLYIAYSTSIYFKIFRPRITSSVFTPGLYLRLRFIRFSLSSLPWNVLYSQRDDAAMNCNESARLFSLPQKHYAFTGKANRRLRSNKRELLHLQRAPFGGGILYASVRYVDHVPNMRQQLPAGRKSMEWDLTAVRPFRVQ